MSSFTEYVAIFQTALVDPPFRGLIIDPVKLDVLDGPIAIRVPIFLRRSIPAGKESTLMEERDLILPAGERFLVATARTYGTSARAAQIECDAAIDRVITALALQFSTDLLCQPVYRGFTATTERRLAYSWLRQTQPIALDFDATRERTVGVAKHLALNGDLERRFDLMSRFFTKAVAYPPGEERFVMLWTVLEIFPMRETSDIAPLSQYLSSILGRDPQETKKKLDIGRLFGHRSSLIHDGILDIPFEELGQTMGKLEQICRTVMRSAAGLHYDGSLEEYFAAA